MGKKKAKFEELLADLEKTVEQLESGELSLDEALECYEKGINTYKACHKILSEAEKKVRMLVQDDEGNLTEEAFEGDASESQS